MRRIRVISGALLAALIAVTLAAGCGSKAAPQDISESAVTEAASPDVPLAEPLAEADRTPITLNVWYSASGPTGEAFLREAGAFDESSDLVDLNLSYSGSSDDTAYKVNAAQLTGTAPDVALMYAGPVFTGGTGDFSMDELIKRDGFDAQDIYPGLWDFCRYYSDDRVCAVPYGISTQLLYYNRDLVERAGVDLSDPPETWDEFKTILEACRDAAPDKGTAAFDAVQADWLFKSMLHQCGSPLIETDGTSVTPSFSDSEAAKAAAFWQSLVSEGLMPAGEHAAAEDRFLAGQLTFLAMSSNRIPRWEDAGLSIGAIPMPSFDRPSTAVGGTVLVILTDDRQRVEAAWDLISYLLEPGHHASFALASGYLPVRMSELDLPEVKNALQDNALYGIAFDQLKDIWTYTYFDDMGLLNLTIDEVIESLERSGRPPGEILNEASEKLSEQLSN